MYVNQRARAAVAIVCPGISRGVEMIERTAREGLPRVRKKLGGWGPNKDLKAHPFARGTQRPTDAIHTCVLYTQYT